MKNIKYIIIIILSLFILTGCNNKNKEVVNVLNWSSYIPNDIVTNFEKESGIKVNYSTYSSNEELLAKLSSSKEGTYDLIFPSDYMVELMKNRNMLERIDKYKLQNYNNINKVFLNQEFDINNNYSLPFLLATTVIAVNQDNISEDITSYKDLMNDKYKNDIVLLDDVRITSGMGLLATGSDMNSVNDNELNNAKNWLNDLNKNIKAFDNDSPKTFLITNETNIGVMWNAEALLAKEKNNNIKIIYPSEGHALSLDNYAIVKGSKNKDNAYKFIDYLLKENVSREITESYPYINTTINARNMSDEELLEVFYNGHYVKNIGEDIKKYDKLWAEIK